MKMKPSFWLAGALLAASGPAFAQAPPAPATPPAATAPPATGHSTDCTPSKTVGQGPSGALGTTTGQSNEPIGDKLAKSDGILCPPSGVDPEMRAPTPDVGNTPVIPPPGSPGGDPSLRPK
jgi:hypothetical protein